MGLGEGTSGPLAPAAFRNSKNSAPSRVGKPSVEWLTMSVCTWSARLNRIASPRGFASGELSGILGSPVELEKRTVTGVDSRVTWGALVSDVAPGAGRNVPRSIRPFAWAG